MLSTLQGISSEVELLVHGVLRFLSADDGENVHTLRGGQFDLYMVQPEVFVNLKSLSKTCHIMACLIFNLKVKNVCFEDKDKELPCYDIHI